MMITTTKRERPACCPSVLITENRLLRPVKKIVVPARTKSFSVAGMLEKENIYVHDTLLDRLGLKAGEVIMDSSPKRQYVALYLKANADDTRIRKKLPKNHLSTMEDIISIIKRQLKEQLGDKPGFLLNNHWANICYLPDKKGEVFCADVFCDDDGLGRHRRWRILDLDIDDGHGVWGKGDLIVCPGDAVL